MNLSFMETIICRMNRACMKSRYRQSAFSTISLSSYGRVSYNLSSSHVRMKDPNGLEWECATAQKVTMSINQEQTKDKLVELYMDRVDVEVMETRSKKRYYLEL